MTERSKTILKGYFNTGDIPTETNFSDMIDSFQRQSVYDVRDYGAVGDGITDDTTAIQAAITAASNAGGGVVLIPTGTYIISSTIYPTGNNIEIVGKSKKSIIKVKDGANLTNVILFYDGYGATDNFVIDNLVIDGNKANQTSGTVTINVSATTNVKIQNTHILNSYGTAIIFILSAHYGSISNCYFNGTNGTNVRVADSDNFKLNNCIVNANSASQSIRIETSDYFTITNNKVTESFLQGIFTIECDYGIISNNILINTGDDSIGIAGSSYVTISNNLITNSQLNGIAPSSQPGVVGKEIIISGNVINTPALTGILAQGDLDDFSGITIVGNICNGSVGYSGIELNTLDAFTLKDFIISGNICRDNLYGISVLGLSSNGRVSDNHISGSSTPYTSGVSVTDVRLNNNIGWVTSNLGAAATIADGGTIAHGLVAAPTIANVSIGTAGEIVTITSLDATNITVAIKDNDGSAGTTQTVYWEAKI